MASARGAAQGGPPLITDDPDTPGPGHWEINIAAISGRSEREQRIEAPLADINYGVGQRMQLKFEIPWVFVRERGGPVQTGVGNSTLGLKWRFLGEEGRRVAWSIYPQLEMDSGSTATARGQLPQGRRFLFPMEITFGTGVMEINAEAGMNFVQHGDDGQIYGLSTEVTLQRRFELLAEVHAEQSSGPAEVIVDVGARPRLTPQFVLLLSAGGAVHGEHRERTALRVYLGVQVNLPRQFQFEPAPPP
jgi:hypothetical protein